MPVKIPKSTLSPGAEGLKLHMRADKVAFIEEHPFDPHREWRLDFVICGGNLLAVEVDGGNRMAVIGTDGEPYAVGRHTKPEDYEKLNAAVLLGWRVLRFTPDQVKSGYAINTIKGALHRARG